MSEQAHKSTTQIPLSQRTFKGCGIELRPVEPRDLPSLRRWRNSDRIRLQMFDQSHIMPSGQIQWFRRIRERDDQAHWVVWAAGARAGYVNIKAAVPLQKAEQVDVGMYTGQAHPASPFLGLAMGVMQIWLAFDVIGARRIAMAVKDQPGLLRFNRELGYREVGRRDGFVDMAITPDQFHAAEPRIRKLLER